LRFSLDSSILCMSKRFAFDICHVSARSKPRQGLSDIHICLIIRCQFLFAFYITFIYCRQEWVRVPVKKMATPTPQRGQTA
jgi:hypothetical protein